MKSPAGLPPEVLMVTASYPFVYEGGEMAFLPPEVDALVPALRRGEIRLRIAPLASGAVAVPLPQGVVLDDGLARARLNRRIADTLLAWRWPGFWPEFGRALREGGVVGTVRVLRWASMARSVARWLSSPAQQQATVGYSYWRGGATLALAHWAASRPHRAVITRAHRFDLYEDAFHPPFQPFASVYAELDCVLVIAEHGRRYLLERGVAAGRLRLARLGTPASPRAAASCDGVWRVLSVAFLRPEKRVWMLASALSRLAAAHPGQRIEWTHFGDGPQRSTVEKALSEAPANLQWRLAGTVLPAQVREHYAREPVDLFVQLSESEGLPVAVMEALSAGVPVMATDVGGVREAVDDEVGALLPASIDIETVARRLGALLGRPDGPALREAARARWAAGFDSERTHAGFAQWLAALAAATAARQ